MSITAATVLKKLAATLLSDRKALKKTGGIILGVIIVICMPMAAVLGIFSGSIEIDPNRLQTLVNENLSAEFREELAQTKTMMDNIELFMRDKALPARSVKKAQVLYVLVLFHYDHQDEFLQRLVDCFQDLQTDEELIQAVNDAFGCNILLSDFQNVMNSIQEIEPTETEE